MRGVRLLGRTDKARFEAPITQDSGVGVQNCELGRGRREEAVGSRDVGEVVRLACCVADVAKDYVRDDCGQLSAWRN
jgi:hypothetical protein